MKTSRIQDFIACVNDAGSIDTTSDKMGVEIRFVFMCRIPCWWIGTCTQMGLRQVNMKEKCVFTFTQFKLHKDLKMDFFASDYLCPLYSPASKKMNAFHHPLFPSQVFNILDWGCASHPAALVKAFMWTVLSEIWGSDGHFGALPSSCPRVDCCCLILCVYICVCVNRMQAYIYNYVHALIIVCMTELLK